MNGTPADLAAVSIVLVRPESPGNVGAVARVIRNFGLGRLRIVESQAHDDADARRLAHRSIGVLRAAREFPDLATAVRGMRRVVATSGRVRSKTPPPLPVRAAARELVADAAAGPVAVVFGPESDGLSLAELAMCDGVARIPQRTDGPALNLAQAVAIFCHEIFEAALVPGVPPPDSFAERDLRERVLGRMSRVARHTGLPVRNRPEELVESLRGFLDDRVRTDHDFAVFERWLSQIEWFVGLRGDRDDG